MCKLKSQLLTTLDFLLISCVYMFDVSSEYTGELISGSRPFCSKWSSTSDDRKSLLFVIMHSNNQENVKQGVLSLHPWS